MPEDDLANVKYLVKVADFRQEIEVTAAYVADGGGTIHSVGGSAGDRVICLKDAAHKVVFQAPQPHVAYVRRADSTRIPGADG